MTDPLVTLDDIQPGIAQITIADVEGKNAFSEPLIRALVDAFGQIDQQKRHNAVILTGQGNYFCSGGTKDILTDLYEGKARFSDGSLYNLPLDCEVPVIAAMQGHAIGGGFVFGLFADFVVLSRESVYTANFMKYGFTPGMGATLIVPAKLGTALGHEMLLGARNYRGLELAERGVPYPVVGRADVLERATEIATDLARMPRASLVLLKQHLVANIRRDLPSVIQQELQMHADTFHEAGVKDRIETLFGR